MATERTDLRRYESDAIRDLLGAYQLAYCAQRSLGKRLDAVGKKGELGAATNTIRDTAYAVLRTVSCDKLATLRKNLEHLEVTVKTKKPVTGSTDESFTYVSIDRLRGVLIELAKHKCGLCLGGSQEMQNCSLWSMLNETLLEDVPANPYRCRYIGVEWCDEEEC
jgi:hypothetical protein